MNKNNWNQDFLNILNDILARIHGTALSLQNLKDDVDCLKKSNEEVNTNSKLIY